MSIQKIMNDYHREVVSKNIEELQKLCHDIAVQCGWWTDLETGQPKDRSPLELMALVHSEISEAVEGMRKNKQDEHLPHLKSQEVELADAIIRIFDYAGKKNLRLGQAFSEKLLYNTTRKDHKIENRRLDDGKKY